MRIAIAGCGITGAAAGSFLSSAGHEVTVFEQAEECRNIGAGILIQPSGQHVLKQLDLYPIVKQEAAILDGLEARLANGRQLIRLRYGSGPDSCGWGVHRGRLFGALLKRCRDSGAVIQTNSRIRSFEESSAGIRFIHDDGSQSEEFDFAIAADGSRSILRKASDIPSHSIEYPYAALWTTSPCTSITDRLFQVIDSTKRLTGILPIGNNEASFFWGLRKTDHSACVNGSFDEWRKNVIELCPAAENFLDPFQSFDSFIFSEYRHAVMSRWHTEKLIFLGDAAHPTSPHLGQGANLGLEDAAAFSQALAATRNFADACRNYTRQRRAKLRYYQTVTRLLTPFFQSDIPLLAWGRNLALPWMPSLPLVGSMMRKTLRGEKQGWLN